MTSTVVLTIMLQILKYIGTSVAYVLGILFGFAFPKNSSSLNSFRIFIVGSGLAGVFLFSAGYVVPGGADEFLKWANALSNGSTLPSGAAERDVGFPLLLALSGYTISGSFIGITLVHTAFAVLMPVSLYVALRPFSSGVAYYGGQIGNICLGSFLFIKMIYHDQSFIFFTVIMVTWFILFLTKTKNIYLYLFTLSCLFASVSRPAGNLLFPLFLLLAIITAARPRPIRHFVACVAIFVCATALYQWHRYEIFDMRSKTSVPSYVGGQVFYNLYLNSREYGITLDPNIGPNMRQIDTALRSALAPIPQESGLLRRYLDEQNVPSVFASAEFSSFTLEDLIRRIYLLPNWEYYMVILYAEPNDQILLGASLEIIKRYPLYFLRYSWRNTVVFLFHPGYAHTRYNVNPFSPIRLDFYPALAGIDGSIRNAPPEAKVQILSYEPRVIQEALEGMMSVAAKLWVAHYQKFVALTSSLMVIAWAALAWAAACAIGRRWRDAALCEPVALWSQPGFLPSLLSASILLLYEATITGVFAEPDYRYHHFVLLLRVLVAGFGAIVLRRTLHGRLSLLPLSFAWTGIARLEGHLRKAVCKLRLYDIVETGLVERRWVAAVIAFGFIAGIFIGWSAFMLAITS